MGRVQAQKKAAAKRAQQAQQANASQTNWDSLVDKVGEQTAETMYPGGVKNSDFLKTVQQ